MPHRLDRSPRTAAVPALFAVAFTLAACDKAEPPAPPAPSARVTPAPEAASGTPTPTPPMGSAASAPAAALTPKKLEDAKAKIKGGQPFAEAAQTLFTELGPPTGKDGQQALFWRAIEGDKCAKLTVSKQGNNVGPVELSVVDKMMASMWKECATP